MNPVAITTNQVLLDIKLNNMSSVIISLNKLKINDYRYTQAHIFYLILSSICANRGDHHFKIDNVRGKINFFLYLSFQNFINRQVIAWRAFQSILLNLKLFYWFIVGNSFVLEVYAFIFVGDICTVNICF